MPWLKCYSTKAFCSKCEQFTEDTEVWRFYMEGKPSVSMHVVCDPCMEEWKASVVEGEDY